MARTKRTVMLVELNPGEAATLPPRAKILAVDPVLMGGQPTARRLILVDTAPPREAPEHVGAEAQIMLQAAQIVSAHPEIEFSDKVKRLAGYEPAGEGQADE